MRNSITPPLLQTSSLLNTVVTLLRSPSKQLSDEVPTEFFQNQHFKNRLRCASASCCWDATRRGEQEEDLGDGEAETVRRLADCGMESENSADETPRFFRPNASNTHSHVVLTPHTTTIPVDSLSHPHPHSLPKTLSQPLSNELVLLQLRRPPPVLTWNPADETLHPLVQRKLLRKVEEDDEEEEEEDWDTLFDSTEPIHPSLQPARSTSPKATHERKTPPAQIFTSHTLLESYNPNFENRRHIETEVLDELAVDAVDTSVPYEQQLRESSMRDVVRKMKPFLKQSSILIPTLPKSDALVNHQSGEDTPAEECNHNEADHSDRSRSSCRRWKTGRETDQRLTRKAEAELANAEIAQRGSQVSGTCE
ncbi:hypothetical protein BLNAU_17067 [Blattamonas nauphoetae]|uniref:Uncharacterized protein n=1 Tax=Blattamonas nauphoetae TaxID=2049346 RepID=A0ABQ9X7T5_9EUKA|nr:hypothetical protein BLNAU_17067 [Blattamonas nauphoetae]